MFVFFTLVKAISFSFASTATLATGVDCAFISSKKSFTMTGFVF